MGLNPFELPYKEQSLVGCEREVGGDSSFMAMEVFELRADSQLILFVCGGEGDLVMYCGIMTRMPLVLPDCTWE